MQKSKLQSKEARVSRKQQELLAFIISFIKGNNYGPSYREIMRALDYKSVSTVAVHVDSLITKGYIRKTDNSARSIEIVPATETKNETSQAAKQTDGHMEWLRATIMAKMDDETLPDKDKAILSRSLEILGIKQSGE